MSKLAGGVINSLCRRLRVPRVLTVTLIFVRVVPASVEGVFLLHLQVEAERGGAIGQTADAAGRPVADLHPHLIAVDGDDLRLMIGHEAAQLFDRDLHRHRRNQMLLEEIVGAGRI